MVEKYIKRQINDGESVDYFVAQGMAPVVAQALSARGITKDNASEFLGECTHSPFEMKNMAQAVEIVNMMMEQGGSVLIYGDYDTDGLTASTILSLFFSDNGIDNDVIIPTRDEGYGLHADLVLKAFEKKFYDLIITVDCGISCPEDVAKIVDELDAEIIVTDHHELPEVLPNCLCVNPKMGYPFLNLAGAGVAWKLVEGVAGRAIAEKYCYLAAIGTIGDVMPIVDENRNIINVGLANFKHKGLQKIAEILRCSSPVTISDVAMKISPVINAAGRVFDPKPALNLLLQRDSVKNETVEEILALNDERKAIVAEFQVQAEELFDYGQIYRDRLVFVHSDKWSHGTLGILASRFKEKFALPAVVLTKNSPNDDVYVGSARGIDGIDLHALFGKVAHLLPRFGGHKASVGFSVLEKDLDELRQSLAQELSTYDADVFQRKIYYDVDLNSGVSLTDMYACAQQIENITPQDPLVFKIKDTVEFADFFGRANKAMQMTLSGGVYLKSFKCLEFVPFLRNGMVEAVFTLGFDDFTKQICGTVQDLHLLNALSYDRLFKQNFLKNFQPKKVESVTEKQVEKILQSSSTLVVFDDYATYLQQEKIFQMENYFADIFLDGSISDHTVVVSPVNGYPYEKYRNVLYFCKNGMMRSLPERTEYFCVEGANSDLYTLELNRDICVAVYAKLKRKSRFDTVRSVYEKYLVGTISYDQYVVALRVFEELKFIRFVGKDDVELLPSEKVDLTSSQIFKCFAN